MSLQKLSLHSEPFGKSGNIGGNSKKLLGAPALDPLQTVIREALQNIVDAANPQTGPEIVIRIRTLTGDQQAAMRDCILADAPSERNSKEKISAFLARENPVVMEICDFGTSGLGGPTRADRIPVGTTTTDFIDFLRNIGTVRDTPHGGGTYGFGKMSLYQVSQCSTILVDTLVAGAESGSRRLMGCHIGASFQAPDDGMIRRYTGRHWWGVMESGDDEFVEPLLDVDAANLAGALGFLPRSRSQSGTSIMILDFDLQGEDTEVVGQRIVETLLLNFWPKMMSDIDPKERFICRVEVDGKPLVVPRPEDCSPLDLFSKAMRAARKGSGNDVRRISSRRPNKYLGTLAIENGLRPVRRQFVGSGSLFQGSCGHIALMRPVELVVKYLEGAPLPDERMEWAGVFIASSEDEVESAFAESEPPTHDDWVPGNLLKGPAKSYVNIALRELKQYAYEKGNSARGMLETTSSGPPLARVAGRLGAMLEGTSGFGGGNRRGGGGNGSSRPAKARASRPMFVRLERDKRDTVAVFETEVRQDDRLSGALLLAEAAVAIEGSANNKVEDHGLKPTIIDICGLGQSSSDGSQPLLYSGSQARINGAEGRFEIRVRMPADCAVTVSAKVLEGERS